MFFVSITRLRVRSFRFLPLFALNAFRSSQQARKAAGILALRVLRDHHHTYWTNSVWESETAVKAYMVSGAHGRVMKRLLDWCDEASVVHWAQATPDMPTWTDAWRRMQQDGRRSKVRHPSSAQTAYEIPEPVVSQNADVRFK